jgi:hypothetical protein
MKGRRARVAFHETVAGRDLRLLGRAIRRVPMPAALDAEKRQGREWDGHTGLYLRPRG